MEKVKKHSLLYKILRIILIFFIVLIILAAVIFIWQKDNILSAYKGITASAEDIASEIADSKAVVNEVLAEYDTPVLRNFTLEEEEKIRRGELTVDEALALILNESEAESGDETSGLTGGSAESGGSSGLSGDENNGSVSGSEASLVDQNALVGNAVKKLYSLKAYYIGRLGSLESEMKSEYIALPADQRGTGAVSSIVSSHMGEVTSLESECDSQVSVLLSQLKSDLESIGADTSIVSTLDTQYQNEKNLRKSYYVSTCLN
ncbi:MAG: hypothetical protein LUG24_08585 [Clostridiales bacterium]|nr:hypothetical protein [Clostridiales bacterium]